MKLRFVLALASTLATIAALLLTSASVFAKEAHDFSTTFGFGSPQNPGRMAVSQSTGHVYVAEQTSGGEVFDFERSGEGLALDSSTPHLTGISFQEPSGVAVDNSIGSTAGDIYVADYDAGAVYQFEPSGASSGSTPITVADVPAPGTSQSGGLPPVVNNGNFGPVGVAVDAEGNVYVGDNPNAVVDQFKPDGEFIAQFGAGRLSNVQDVAVDDSATSSAGDLYVANYFNLVGFEPSGACLEGCNSFGGGSNQVFGVAVDGAGNVYADEYTQVSVFSSSGRRIDEFGSSYLSGSQGIGVDDSNGAVYLSDTSASDGDIFDRSVIPNVTTGSVTNTSPTSATLTGEVDPDAAHGGGPGTGCHFEYGLENGSYSLGDLPCLNSEGHEVGTPTNPIETLTKVHGELSDLQTLTTYHYRLVAANENGTNSGSDQTVELSPNLPTVDSTSSSDVRQNSATLDAQINPGFGPTIVRFQYGTTTTYGEQTYPSASIGSDDSDHPASDEISELTPGTSYHFRAVATNFMGTVFGPDQTFSTPSIPSIASTSATTITRTSAILEAQISPDFSQTTYHFEYGTTGAYGSSTPESTSIGSDNSSHGASSAISGLMPGTTYHYRVVATNAVGTTEGSGQTFATEPKEEALETPPKGKCKKGFVMKHGKCLKKSHKKAKHRRRSTKHA